MNDLQYARFKKKIHKRRDGCWEWTASRFPTGYGQFNLDNSSNRYAHRISYEHFRDIIPEGMEIDHVCRNRWCVNPEHLEVVSKTENMAREAAGRTHCARGHEWTPENTYTARGYRECRTCNRERSLERYHNLIRPLELARRDSSLASSLAPGFVGVAA